jgi:hypothetical protein
VRRSIPSDTAPRDVGARQGSFDRDLHLYVPTGAEILQLRTEVAAALAGSARFRIAWIGTSIVSGWGTSSPGTTDPVVQARNLFDGRANSGVVKVVNGNPGDPDDNRLTYSALEWNHAGSARSGVAGGDLQMFLRNPNTTSGQTLTFTSDVPGTVVEIATLDNSGACSVSIDGAAKHSVQARGSGAVRLLTVTGLAPTTHEVEVTSSGTGRAVYVAGFSVRDDVGLEMENWGYYGSVASDWEPGGAPCTGHNEVDALRPDAVLIQLGANEAIHGLGANALKKALGHVVEAHKAARRTVVVIVDPPIESDMVTDWATRFRSAIYDVADVHAVPLVDLTEAWGHRAAAAALGYYTDEFHPTDAGAASIAAVVHAALTS